MCLPKCCMVTCLYVGDPIVLPAQPQQQYLLSPIDPVVTFVVNLPVLLICSVRAPWEDLGSSVPTCVSDPNLESLSLALPPLSPVSEHVNMCAK